MQILLDKKYKKYNDSYNYLIKMTMDSVCEDNVISLKETYNSKKKELEYIKNIKNDEIWKKELNILSKELDKSFKF